MVRKKPKNEITIGDKIKFGVARAIYSIMGFEIKKEDTIGPIYNEFRKNLGISLGDDTPKEAFMGLGRKIRKNIIYSIPLIDKKNWNTIMSDKSNKSLSEKINCVICELPLDKKDYTKIDNKKLFKNVMVANRGEIAIRIIRACKELDIKTTIIYTKHDKDALATKYADHAYCLDDYEGDVPNGYLDSKRIINICKIAKADAIHPGYGFLSENSEFARQCEENKIKFIGPHSKTIYELGDKAIAKETMQKNNIPVVYGSDSLDTAEEALEFAKKIGFPVIIKAAEGGGGKGMRIVKKEKEFIKSYDSAKAESKSAFNSERVFVEKYIKKPKHIEFQILADQHKNVVHFGERDCSIQRRHQKLLEEAPSPALSDKLRLKMGEVAIKAASAVDYEGVGTVEFLLDSDNNFYFMEMNTRIQVEHGVTEIVTGVDLVKEQIMVAAGAEIAYKQKDIQIKGWALECRINAEDPMLEFKPCPGKITEYLPPGGPGVRLCSCAHTGFEISPFYDSMIAKLITQGQTRTETIDRMKRALDEFKISGVKTTIPFHQTVIENKQFRKGNITTDFIDKEKIMERLSKSELKALDDDKTIAIISAAIKAYLKDSPSQSIQRPIHTDNWVLASRIDNFGDFESENGTF